MRVVWLAPLLLALACVPRVGEYDYDDESAEDADDAGQVVDAGARDGGSDAASAVLDAADRGRDAGIRNDAAPADAGNASGLGCADEALWIYAIAANGALLRYEPNANAVSEVGFLDCPSGSSPFSMAVSRDAIAYVLHADRKIYQVDTSDATCRETAYVPGEQGFEAFGMGFVSDQPGGSEETLFIAGGLAGGLGSSRLGAIDTRSWAVTSLSAIDGAAELTGNGNAELWAFIADASPIVVRQLDKRSGETLREFDVSSIDRTASASAWAFAFWGGRYYIFYQSSQDESSSVYRLTPELSLVEPVYEDTGYRIVGAGVSTCAPTILL